MQGLDQPVAGPGQQAQLRDPQRRHDQAPDEDYEREPAGAGHEKARDGEHPHTDDEESAEQHVEREERQGVAGPEEDSEHHESDAEEAEE